MSSYPVSLLCTCVNTCTQATQFDRFFYLSLLMEKICYRLFSRWSGLTCSRLTCDSISILKRENDAVEVVIQKWEEIVCFSCLFFILSSLPLDYFEPAEKRDPRRKRTNKQKKQQRPLSSILA